MKVTICDDSNTSIVDAGPIPENLANIALVLIGHELSSKSQIAW